jgi:hypothetical protein
MKSARRENGRHGTGSQVVALHIGQAAGASAATTP